MILSLLFACDPAADSGETAAVGALALGRMNPFPSLELMGNDRLSMVEGDLPVPNDGGTAWDYTPFNLRNGFSVVQPSVALFADPLDPESIGGPTQVGIDGSVLLIDLDSGESIPCFAELDAAPEAIETGLRALIVRPMVAMTSGHRVAVVVTSAVTSGGSPLSVPAAEGHYADLRSELATLGFSDVTVAWDFPVGEGRALLDGILAARTTPATHRFDREWYAGDVDPPVPTVLQQAEGSFTADNWLIDETHVELDATGAAVKQGSREAYLWVVVPDSVKDAAPGSVPVLVFGHGIMSEPEDYLGEDDDPNGVIQVANKLGAIVVATKWTGLTKDDRLHAIEVAGDFARFHEIPEMLAQSVADTTSLIDYVANGTLLADPIFGGLADPTNIAYYGISLGGIEGAVTLANQAMIQRGVLHVGGSAWATMLERSAQWPPFDLVVTNGFADPFDRQLLYAATQVLWEPVDPAAHVDRLLGREFLWQESYGDEQVPNMTTEILARSLGLSVLEPTITSPFGLVSVPAVTTAPVMSQFDPETALPPDENRPAVLTGAHSDPRLWPGTQQQIVQFLTTGEVDHFCGTAICSASNPGSW